MNQNNPQPEKPSWVSRAFRFIVRFLFVVVLGLVLGGGLYLGVTYLANRYFQSTQVNSQQIQALSDNQILVEEQAKQRLDDVISRLQSLETSGDSLKVVESDNQSRLAALETAQPTPAVYLETLTYQQEQISTLQANLSRIQSTQLALNSEVRGIAQDSADQFTAIQTLSAEWPGTMATLASSLQDVQLLKAMEMLSRARFNLYQNNLGLARQDIQSAREIILAVQSQVDADQSGISTAVLARLDGALGKLPDFPVAASDEIEDAWSLLVSGTTNAAAGETPVSSTPTPNLTPGPAISPTPSPTLKP